MPALENSTWLIRAVPAAETPRLVNALAALLDDAVAHGASLGFTAATSREAFTAYWQTVAGAVQAGRVALWVAESHGAVVGAVQLELAEKPNARHRAEVQKLLVRHAERGRGLGSQLMHALEAFALAHGRTLLVLDTETGSPAEAMYAHWGWRKAGEIPRFARSPSGELRGTTLFYKELSTGVTR